MLAARRLTRHEQWRPVLGTVLGAGRSFAAVQWPDHTSCSASRGLVSLAMSRFHRSCGQAHLHMIAEHMVEPHAPTAA